MIHKDDEQHTGGGMFIADNESDFVITSIAPAIEKEELDLEEMVVWIRTIDGIIAEGIIHVGDGVIDKFIHPFFCRIR